MKRISLFLTAFLSFSLLLAQETTVNLSMGANYADQVFYKLSTATNVTVAANSWDIAMLRTSSFDLGLRVNDGIGLNVYEASDNPADWANIDVANESSWTKLYNSDTVRKEGAFQQGSATYGWGDYNSVTHHVEGKIIFVLKYNNGDFKKLFIEDYYGGYTFKYSSWDATASTWSADQTVTIPNTDNPNNAYNYYSLQNNQAALVEPAIGNWDFKFTRYYTDITTNNGNVVKYLVTGVLQSDDVTVAQNDEPGGMPPNPTLTYATDINTIGYDWKSFAGGSFVVNSDIAYYVKYADNTLYRLYFTAFGGGSTGNVSFNFEDVTGTLGFEEVEEGITFGMYPNPAVGKKVTLVYDIDKLSANNKVSIFSVTGQEVYSTSLKNKSGFYNKNLDLSHLNTGMYVLQFTSGQVTVSKKLILN